MGKTAVSEADLRDVLDDFGEQFPHMSEDELFVLWFVRAYATGDDKVAADALTGGSGDKQVDAVLIDDDAKVVFLVQGKHRDGIGRKSERRPDVMALAQYAFDLPGDKRVFEALCDGMPSKGRTLLGAARKRVLNRRYRLELLYATTGRCSKPLRREAEKKMKTSGREACFRMITGKALLVRLQDYLLDVAPPVRALDLEIEAGRGVKLSGVLHRYDVSMDIESWVFPMTGQAIAELYEKTGPRLFARNIRWYLGKTEINKGMKATLRDEPEYFWYYNNGITIVCDKATERNSGGRKVIRIENPQVINGQQTTRVLHENAADSQKASVVVRVVRIPRRPGETAAEFEELVSSIVANTNWQNEIRASDLRANDRRQIAIERQLRKKGYRYLRKRMGKGERPPDAGGGYYFPVKKEHLARAVAGCELDPAIVRSGVEGLFGDDLYDTVFPNEDPNYYLTRYILMQEVSRAARGYPERAYAKWLVVHFMWSKLAPLVKRRAAAEHFRKEWENGEDSTWILNSAINKAYGAALRFYRANRGKGETAIDVSNFFKRRRLVPGFERFWRSPKNKARSLFNKTWKRYEKKLRRGLQ